MFCGSPRFLFSLKVSRTSNWTGLYQDLSFVLGKTLIIVFQCFIPFRCANISLANCCGKPEVGRLGGGEGGRVDGLAIWPSQDEFVTFSSHNLELGIRIDNELDPHGTQGLGMISWVHHCLTAISTQLYPLCFFVMK